jgi:hypothetical protein
VKTSEILRQAEHYLWNGQSKSDLEWFCKRNGSLKEQFLCHAVERSVRKGSWNRSAPQNLAQKSRYISDMIESRMYPHVTLNTWLAECANIPKEHLTDVNVQEHRKQWLHLLIKEFQAKGD